jgi:hypothetical protein
MTIVYDSLEPFPTEYSLEELIARCIERDYLTTIKKPKNWTNRAFIPKSILYHLDRLLNGTTRTPQNLIRIVTGH